MRTRQLWIVLALASLGGAAGCKDSNSTIVFDSGTTSTSDAQRDLPPASGADATASHADGSAVADALTDQGSTDAETGP